MQTTYNPSEMLLTWNRERSADELQSFVDRRLASLVDVDL